MKHQHHLRASTAAALAALAAGALLSACGSGAPAPDVTVTVTPTVTAKAPAGGSSTPNVARSDVKGRAFDFGIVRKVSTVAGTAVLELDRLTWTGLSDAKLAQSGVPTGAFTGGVPYTNQNDKLTYTIPVVGGARILYNHCIAPDQPIQTKSIAPAALKGLADRENTVLVQLDPAGRATSITNIPGCPA